MNGKNSFMQRHPNCIDLRAYLSIKSHYLKLKLPQEDVTTEF